MSDQEDFQSAESGASETIPQQCSALRKNQHVLLKGKPCKIVDMSTSKTGKHGHAKVHLVGIDVFTGKKYEDICPSTHNMSVPNLSRKDYMVCGLLDDNYMSLMDDASGLTREDLKVEEEMKKEIQNDKNKDRQAVVSVLKCMGAEKVMALKWED